MNPTSKAKLWFCLLVAFATQIGTKASESTYRFFAEGYLSAGSQIPFHGKQPDPVITHFQITFDSGSWKLQSERNGKDAATAEEFDGSLHTERFEPLSGRAAKNGQEEPFEHPDGDATGSR